MTEAVFRKTVAEYVAMGGGSINLTPTVGDPLIHPKFVEWVCYLRSMPQIDRIVVTTNGILLARHGIEAILDAGLSRINISIAGFDEDMYRRVYRSEAYKKVRNNVTELLALNRKRPDLIPIVLCLRADRPAEVCACRPGTAAVVGVQSTDRMSGDFQPFGGLMNQLPAGMQLAPVPGKSKTQACRRTYMGLVVQSNGDIQACGCESSVNAPALVSEI